MKMGVIKTGGKQYLVQTGELIIVEKIDAQVNKEIELDTLAIFDDENKLFKLGTPFLKEKINAMVVDQLRGDKIRVAKFKSKVRYRKVTGHRQHLTKIKILSI